MARQSEDALHRAENINGTLERWKKATPSKQVIAAIDLLARNPYLTVGSLAGHLKVAFTTAQRTIDKTRALKILEQVNNQKRNRVYCAKKILKILAAPPEILTFELLPLGRSDKGAL